MPQTDSQPSATEATPVEMAGERDAAAEISGLEYVPLTLRSEPPRDRRRWWWVLALVLLGHALLGLLIYTQLRAPPPGQAAGNSVMQVVLVEPVAGPPPPVPPPPAGAPRPPPARPPVRTHYEPPAKGAITATLESAKGKKLDLFGANGQIRLPPGKTEPPAAYTVPGPRASHISSGKSPVQYHPTPYAQAFAPTNQNLATRTIGRAYDKLAKKTTVAKTVHLPGGIKIRCGVSPLQLMAGCVPEPPQPPPKNDDDIRLSMPPPETLTGKKVAVPGEPGSGAPASR